MLSLKFMILLKTLSDSAPTGLSLTWGPVDDAQQNMELQYSIKTRMEATKY